MKKSTSLLTHTLVLLSLVFVVQGCQTLKEIANLRNVDFALGAVSNIDLAGVKLDNVNDYKDIRAGDIVKLTAAFLRKDMPLSFTLDVKANNPADNAVPARLVRLDWTLFLEERETISGSLEEEYVLTPGQLTRIPVGISFELTEFFQNNARDIIELAASLKGEGGASKQVKLVATPIIDTLVGPIRYPEPITIVNESVGG